MDIFFRKTYLLKYILILICLPYYLFSEEPPITQIEDNSLPEGKGGLFIPALTEGKNEPLWVLLNEKNEFISQQCTGEKVIVEPGYYTVIVGSGSNSQLSKIKVKINLNQTTYITPSWGALVVHIIDEEERPFSGVYELFEFTTRDNYGVGRGAEEDLGENVKTWLLKPSIYKIVGFGEDFRTVRNFATVKINSNEVSHFVIVMNRDWGNFIGAGVVPEGNFKIKGEIAGEVPEVPKRVIDRLKAKFLIGGDLNQNATDNNFTAGTSSIGIGLFTTFGLNYLRKKHFWNFIVNIEGGVRKNSEESFYRKVKDQFKLDNIYIYQLSYFVGPYVRFNAISQFTKNYRYFSVPTDVSLIESGITYQDIKKLKLTEGPFDPTFLEEGLGLNFKLLKRLHLDLDARVGLGLRHTLTEGFLTEKGTNSSTEIIEFYEESGRNDVGGELILLPTLRITKQISYSGEINSFYGGGNSARIKMDNTIVWRIVKSISLGILIGLDYNQSLHDRFEVSEGVFLRISQKIF